MIVFFLLYFFAHLYFLDGYHFHQRTPSFIYVNNARVLGGKEIHYKQEEFRTNLEVADGSVEEDYTFSTQKGFDMFGDIDDSLEDVQYLEELRYNKTIANDRWQSNIFREATEGEWIGN